MESPTHASRHLASAISDIPQARLLSQLLDSTSCLIALKDLNHRYLYANAKFEALYGVASGSLIGSVLESHLSFKHITEIHAREKSVIEQGMPAHFFERLVIKGRPHTWETIRFPLRDSSGNITGSGFIAIDVDEAAPLTESQRDILNRANQESASAALTETTAVQGGANPPGFLQVQWRAMYECGNPTIDRQHRALFEQANRLLNAVLADAPIGEATVLVQGLMDDITQHFRDEESILRQAAFPHTEEHHNIHLQLLDRAAALSKQFEARQIVLEDVFRFLAHDVISHHLLGADREFFAFIDRNFVIEP